MRKRGRGYKKMGKSFEDFVKKCLENTYSDDREVVDGVFFGLGNWALAEFIKSANENSLNLDLGWVDYTMSAYALEADRLRMAVACLGEQAVKRKLKLAEKEAKQGGEM